MCRKEGRNVKKGRMMKEGRYRIREEGGYLPRQAHRHGWSVPVQYLKEGKVGRKKRECQGRKEVHQGSNKGRKEERKEEHQGMNNGRKVTEVGDGRKVKEGRGRKVMKGRKVMEGRKRGREGRRNLLDE